MAAGGAGDPTTGTTIFALARFNRDGTLDRHFGTAGRVTTQIDGASYATALAVQPDRRLVTAGVAAPGPSISYGDFAVTRYQ